MAIINFYKNKYFFIIVDLFSLRGGKNLKKAFLYRLSQYRIGA
jgi:hypothetical protein